MITDEDEAHELLGSVAEVRGAIAKPGTGHMGLGYREVLVSSLGDDERHRRAPREFAVGSTAAPDLEASAEIARRLIEAMTKHAEIRLVPPRVHEEDARPIEPETIDRWALPWRRLLRYLPASVYRGRRTHGTV